MYAYKIKPDPSLILFPKVSEKDHAGEITNKDLWIKTFQRIKFMIMGCPFINNSSPEDKIDIACTTTNLNTFFFHKELFAIGMFLQSTICTK